jgi:hypothetical protein
VTGTKYFLTLAAAEREIDGTRGFALWHNPNAIVQRSKKYWTSSFVETVVASSQSRLESLAAIRHRIAHSQADAANKFNAAAMAINGQRYRGARPGRLLRDFNKSSTPRERWLISLGAELVALAAQIG